MFNNMRQNRTQPSLKRMRQLLFALVLVLVFGPATAISAPTTCAEKFLAFLKLPSSSTQKALEQERDDDCWWIVAKKTENFARFTAVVESGNDLAADLLVNRLTSNDGGDLHDAFVALGLYSDRKMHRFMRFVVDGKLSEDHFSRSIASQPTTLTDDYLGQVAAATARRCAANAVLDSKLSRIKAIALKVLDERVAEIRRGDMLSRKNSN